jgi:hypothetical protein
MFLNRLRSQLIAIIAPTKPNFQRSSHSEADNSGFYGDFRRFGGGNTEGNWGYGLAKMLEAVERKGGRR